MSQCGRVAATERRLYGHIPRNWFRTNVWIPARDTAKLNQRVTPHSMLHAHASWLLADGADLAQVGDRLGHSSDNGKIHPHPAGRQRRRTRRV
jgi:integrase